MAKKTKPVEVIDLDALPKAPAPEMQIITCGNIGCQYIYKKRVEPQVRIVHCPVCQWAQYA